MSSGATGVVSMPDPAGSARLWPFPARQPLVEVLEWKTDVLETEGAEQRIALRTLPRSIITFTHMLDAAGMANAAELARAGFSGAWLVPLWHMARSVASAVDAADMVIFTDTTDGAFDGVSRAVIATDGGVAHRIEVGAVYPDRIGLVSPTGVNLLHPVVAPAQPAIMTRALEIDRRRQGLGRVKAVFMLQNTVDLPAAGFPEYLGSGVLTDPAVLRQPLAESLGQSVEYIDNGFGPVVIEPVLTRFRRQSIITLLDRGAARRTRRGWLYGLRGRQRAFWLPTWGRELVLQAPVASSATAITVAPAADPNDWIGRHIMFEDDAMPVFREITGAVYDALGIRLTIAATGDSLPATTPVHLLLKVRLDTDRIELEHYTTRTEFAASVIEVPA